ncbi:MAG: DUF1772 domain-containing protein [Thalassovita sp.]
MNFRVGLLVALAFSAAIFGFFYAWVCSTMWGLDQLPPDTAIEAMNAMNRSVRNAVFAPAFFGTPIVLLLVAAWGWALGHRKVAIVLASAALLYILGAFAPTVMVNVPMNLALMETDMGQTDSLRGIWSEYSERWQVWNTARTVASGVVVLLVGWALLLHGSSLAAHGTKA